MLLAGHILTIRVRPESRCISWPQSMGQTMINVNQIVGPYLRLTTIGDYDDILKQLVALPPSKAVEFCRKASSEFSNIEPTTGAFAYVADTKLSGLPMYCWSPGCRIRDVYDLASYVVLYGDQANMVNPFSFADYTFGNGALSDEKAVFGFLEELAFAVLVVLTIKPLLERGLIRFFDYKPDLACRHCTEKLLLGRKRKNTLRQSFDFFAGSTKCAVYNDDGLRSVLIEYDEKHSAHRIYSSVGADWLDDRKEGDVLSRQDLVEHGIFVSEAQMLTHDFYAKNFVADQVGARHVFSNDFEFSAVSTFANKEMPVQKIQLDYPVLTAVTISDAMRIRDAEWHHVHDFRLAIAEIARAGSHPSGDLLDFFGPRLVWAGGRFCFLCLPLTERLSAGAERVGPTYRSGPPRRIRGRCVGGDTGDKLVRCHVAQ